MRGNRRYLSMGLGALSLLALGFVVAVAARSRPGSPGEDALLDVDIDLSFDLTRILAWMILIMAIIGAVLFAVGVKQANPRPEKRKRNFWSIALAVVVFLVVIRYLRPLAAGLFEGGEAAEAAEPASEIVGPQSGGSSAWLFSILLAAIVVAALTRVGLTVRGIDGSFDMPFEEVTPEVRSNWGQSNIPLVLGSNPRSRVLNAYARFEAATAVRGVGRRAVETALRHGNRAVRELGVNDNVVSSLIATFSPTRFGRGDISVSEAELAEHLSDQLCRELDT